MKKVLIVMASLYNGGAERSLVNLLNELPEDKYEIDILLFKRAGLFLNQVPEAYQVIDTPGVIRRLYGSLDEAGALLPFKLITNGISKVFTSNDREKRAFRWKYFYGPCIKKLDKEYDVALAYISGEILYFLDEKVNARKKIVWIHNDYRAANHPRKYDYDHLKNMDAIVTISDSCADILLDEFPEFKDKIHMIENITSSAVIKNRANEFIPEEFDKNTNVVLSIGRLSEQKGFDMAIEASAIMKKNNIDFKWYVIGTGELEESLKQQIKRMDVEDRFILLGARENPYPYIHNASVFVQPSRYEGKSVVLDEAKILGAAIVATNYPTVSDQMVDGQEGIVVPMSAEGIAEGITRLIKEDKLRDSLKDFLSKQEYGNQDEIEKYMNLMD
ncbi:glycosyltransferase [Butyrivibrio sp. INlla16]|uniref:glycosyltransferase n=1 Tax=Butyrivibrio sp. INlla16 TaxID=1520807 RepID=UPI00088E8443|nr:glycosyltransferase [Butyrivibrio sp. INlla16]SDB66433.1 Glycosyltransferase involved in cell wall bisynthesis [Butyrivibrio sp. INlla16]